MIVTLAKLNRTYAQEQKNMPVVIKKVSITTTLTTAVITTILKFYFASKIIHMIKHYLVSIKSKATTK